MSLPLAFLLASHPAQAGPAVPPPNVLSAWSRPLRLDAPCSRVAMIAESPRPAQLEVLDGGKWRTVPSTWAGPGVSVHALDLLAPRSDLAFREAGPPVVRRLEWDCFTPTAGEPRRAAAPPPPAPGVLPAELEAIGVVSRSDWGADPTTCTATEDDWYRMAIHHTAGSQVYGGTVQGAVQALQAYSFSTGEYCDIPYQFLVGYDGSLWEGRPYDYYSGATGGGNNDGNIAVCFLGCYHPSGCSTSHSVTEAMIDGGQLLVQTLAELHDVPSDEDSIRGHRDWPDNATACPGDWLYDRLDDLREPLGPAYAATLVSLTCIPGDGAQVSLMAGETASCTLGFTNVGSATWTPGLTKLAPIPRDVASSLAAPGWLDPTRMATVAAVTGPRETGYFSFDVYAAAPGEYELDVGLLEEWVTWFADDGGPPDGQEEVFVSVSAPPVEDSAEDPDVPTPGEDSAAPSLRPGERVPLDAIGSGCGCAGTGPTAPAASAVALALLAIRRRR